MDDGTLKMESTIEEKQILWIAFVPDDVSVVCLFCYSSVFCFCLHA